jgi:hypothetical protein
MFDQYHTEFMELCSAMDAKVEAKGDLQRELDEAAKLVSASWDKFCGSCEGSM